MIIGLYPMVADLLHAGHILALKEAKENCDYLIVALHCNPDYKSPVQSVFERFIQLDAVKFIDKVIPYSNKEDAATMITSLNFDVYFLGEDYKNKSFECSDILQSLGKDIYYLKRQHTMSSTDLKHRIVEDAKSNRG